MGPIKRFPLERSQHAYQRGRSSEASLHDLVSRIESALGHKIFAFGAFLDVEGAFDNKQKVLFIVQTWCWEVGLSANADKTLMVLFTNNRKWSILFGKYTIWELS
jgi:hypothetical protein